MEIYLRFATGLVGLFFFTRWLSRKIDPAFGNWPLFVALFFKVFCGCLYGYIFLRVYGGDDTWMLNREALIEHAILKHTPALYFNDLNLARLVREFGWAEALPIFREKLELAFITKPLSVVDFLSEGNYYVNVLAFTAMSFWGQFLFFQLLRRTWPHFSSAFFWLVFLYLPVLFWLSGIRSDGLDFVFLSGALFGFDRWQRKGKGWWLPLLCCLLLAVTRTPFALLLVTGLFCWWLARRQENRPGLPFLLVHLAVILVFFTSSWLPKPFNGPAVVTAKQASFLALEGNTRLPLNRLRPTPGSFVQTAPQAISNVWLHPLPWQANGLLQWLMVGQNVVIIVIYVLGAWWLFPGRQAARQEPLFYFMVSFAVFASFTIGFTVPFPGAIVRYRAIAELFLLTIGAVLVLPAIQTYNNLFNVYKNR